MNMNSHMILKLHKKPNTCFVETDMLLEWVSDEQDENGRPLFRRTPTPEKKIYERGLCFTAGGKRYASLKLLTAVRSGRTGGLYKDCYGRTVYEVTERFPCFDSHDFAHENRYYRWYYLIWKDRLICVHSADGSSEVQVTEDVDVLRKKSWESMQKAGLLNKDLILRIS